MLLSYTPTRFSGFDTMVRRALAQPGGWISGMDAAWGEPALYPRLSWHTQLPVPVLYKTEVISSDDMCPSPAKSTATGWDAVLSHSMHTMGGGGCLALKTQFTPSSEQSWCLTSQYPGNTMFASALISTGIPRGPVSTGGPPLCVAALGRLKANLSFVSVPQKQGRRMCQGQLINSYMFAEW